MKTSSNFIRLLKVFLKPYWKIEIAASLCLVAMSVMILAMPWLIKLTIDEVIIGGNLQLLLIILSGIALIYIFRQVFFFLSHYLIFYVGGRVIFNIRNRLFRHLQYLSIKYYDRRKVGEILSRVTTDVTALQQLFISGVVSLVMPTFTLIMAFIIIICINWRVALIALSILPAYAWVFFHYRLKIRNSSALVREKMSGMSGKLSEVISGVRVIRTFTAERQECLHFNAHNRGLFERLFKCNMLGVHLWMIADSLTGIGTGIVLGFGAYSVIKGAMTLGELTAVLSYTAMLYNPIVQLSSLNNIVQQAMAGADRVLEILDMEQEEAETQNEVKLNNIKGHILFDNISYNYDHNNIPALSDICLEVLPGEVVALVGPSGCGKSTLISLLLRFYDPTSGRIYIDGYDTTQISRHSIRKATGIILQDVFLFSGSITENIRYGRQDATQEEIVFAAQTANAHEFITNLPQGYNTEIRERGGGISVGERQRIAIARAILRDPRILIFDEATSALDSQTERIMQETLNNASRGRTTFIIAHQFSTILKADKIVLMEYGKIMDIGTHKELFSGNDLYRELCEAQFING